MTLVVAFAFFAPNVRKMGTANDILSVCDCNLSS